MSAAREGTWVVGVGVAAALYFSLGIGLTLEWSDEGHVVYPVWRVARGALPYRDFFHLYGPSLFLFNGALLSRFGADLRVLRVALVVVKAVVIALAYAAARMVAPRRFALATTALLIVLWGAPIWVFNAPYANHYAMAFILAGLVTFAAMQRRLLAACLLAGLCFGLASTFKQTAGLFAYIGLGLALLRRAGMTPSEGRTGDGVVRLARLTFLVVAGGMAARYLGRANTLANATVLAMPLGVVVAALAVDELRGSGTARARRAGLQGLLAVSVGFALPLLAFAGYFAAHGALRELLFNTGTGWPRLMRWFEPIPAPSARAILSVALAVVAGWLLSAGGPRRSVGAALAIGVGAALVGVAFARGDATNLALHQLTLLLFLVVWWGVAAAFADRLPPRVGSALGLAPTPVDALPVFAFAGAAGVLLLHPSADLPHVLMAWPLFMPLLTHALWRWYAAAAERARRPRRLALGALVAGLLAALGAPFVGMLAGRLAHPAGIARFARASGVDPPERKAVGAARVVDYLAQRPDGPLLVLCNEQMLYFLAGRDSVVAPEEFVLYLVGSGLIDDADARRYLDDSAFVARLEAERPLVIDHPGLMTARLLHAYPGMAQALAAHYRAVYRGGGYQVLEWRE